MGKKNNARAVETKQPIVIYMPAWGHGKKQLSRPCSVLFIFHSTSAKFDSMSDISFHEKKKHTHTRKHRAETVGFRGGGGHCQLRGSRPCGGSLDLVFNLAVLNPGRQAKVTEQ